MGRLAAEAPSSKVIYNDVKAPYEKAVGVFRQHFTARDSVYNRWSPMATKNGH